jgi:hypothetical protein
MRECLPSVDLESTGSFSLRRSGVDRERGSVDLRFGGDLRGIGSVDDVGEAIERPYPTRLGRQLDADRGALFVGHSFFVRATGGVIAHRGLRGE